MALKLKRKFYFIFSDGKQADIMLCRALRQGHPRVIDVAIGFVGEEGRGENGVVLVIQGGNLGLNSTFSFGKRRLRRSMHFQRSTFSSYYQGCE